MPERLNRAQVATSRGPVEISWDARAELLERLRRDGRTLAVIRAFEAVGTSRPVTLTTVRKALLLRVLDAWASEVGADALPPEIVDLRAELLDDLDAAGFWRK